MRDVKLNKEQLQAVKYKDGPLLIIAGAGTGKTTVITERIKYLILSKKAKTEEILALTFTEKAAREMEERVDVAMPYGYTQMWISTFHSFCDRILRREALHIGLDPKYHLATVAETVQFVRNNIFKFDLDYFRPLGNPTKFIGGMLQHFSRLQDEDVTPNQYLDWAKSKFKTQKSKLKEKKIEITKWLELANAYKTYEELKVKDGVMDFGDLIVKCLKLFRDRPNVLREYQNQFKYVLVDEFQDTNYAQNELAILLAGKSKNITVCGDDDQCLPAPTRVSTPLGDRQIKDIKAGDEVITAVGKGHTSSSKVTRVFKNMKKRRLLKFRTESGKRITVTDNHKMFCFIPAHYDLKDWHFVYIMHHKDLGWRIGVTNNLPNRLRLERQADLIIGIGSYKTDQEARYYEAYYSVKYGIPTVPFSPRLGQAIAGGFLEQLFREIDTETNISKLAIDLRLELDSPQFLVDAVTRGSTKRIKINFEMCSRNYRSKTHKDGFVGNPAVSHAVSLETSNLKVIRKLKKAGVNIVKAKKGVRVRRSFADIKEAWALAEKLQEMTDGIIDKRFKVGRFKYQHLPSRIVPASHVFPGMYLPVLRGKQIHYEKVVSRSEREEAIKTYDLEIEKTHNFIADGVVVHNSIYRFRGAAVSNIIQFRKNFPKSKIVVLTKNYRSTQEILDRAYQLIQHNNPDRLEAVEKIDKKLIAQRKERPPARRVFSEPVGSMNRRSGPEDEEISFIHADRVENEAEAVAKDIKRLKEDGGYEWKDFAILVRANNHSEPFGRALARKAVPYQFLGPGRLFKQSEVVDLIAYLKVLYNLEDSVSFYRLLSIDFFDISPRDLVSIGNYARKLNKTFFEVCERIDDVFVTTKTKEKVKKILEIVGRHLKLVRRETAGQLLYYFLSDTGLLQKMLSPESAEAEKRAVNISKFFDRLKTYEVDHEDATVSAVVDWLELSLELGESPLAADTDWVQVNAVNILTVHSAKGLEFPVVFLVNLVGQRFPTIERREQIPIPDALIKEVLPVGDYHLEEERRLFYVGMTRARDRLLFSAADYYGEGKREKRLSPFIFETLGDEAITSEASRQPDSTQLSFLDYTLPNIQAAPQSGRQTVHIDYLSYSQIETFRICPLHYKLKYIFKVPTPPSSSQSFGNTFHITMKAFYEAVTRGEKPTEKLMYKFLTENWIAEGYLGKKHEAGSFEKAKKFLKHYLENTFNPKIKPIAMEQPFMVALDGLKVGGKMDRVDVHGDTLEIIDYKTGATALSQSQADNDLQLSIYALAATSIPEFPFARKPESVKLSLYYFDNPQIVTTERTKEQLTEARKTIGDYKKQIENSDFLCSGNMLCEKCEYSLFCRSES